MSTDKLSLTIKNDEIISDSTKISKGDQVYSDEEKFEKNSNQGKFEKKNENCNAWWNKIEDASLIKST